MLFSSAIHVEILRTSGSKVSEPLSTAIFVYPYHVVDDLAVGIILNQLPITFQVPTNGVEVESKGIYSFEA